MFKRVYLEISNICNLSCSFCPGTKRPPHSMSAEEFRGIAEKLKGHTNFLCFHLMGEPLVHPHLGQLLDIAHELAFRVIITTNASLLDSKADTLLASKALYQVNFSLQAYEGCGCKWDLGRYIASVCSCAKRLSEAGVYCSLRLWNGGGLSSRNEDILRLLRQHFPDEWELCLHNRRLAPGIFLEQGLSFDWPDISAPEAQVSFCHGLRNQLGVLCDGTVVPCCLDSEGSIPLGNLHVQSLDSILSSPRAAALYEGFSRGQAVEQLCRHCGYASRF